MSRRDCERRPSSSPSTFTALLPAAGLLTRDRMSGHGRDELRAEIGQKLKTCGDILRSSALTSESYHKIHRLHNDKIGHKGIAAEVGCAEQEVAAALWKPSASNAYTLWRACEEASSPDLPASFSERAKLLSERWGDIKQGKRSDEYAAWEAKASDERQVMIEFIGDWKDFLSKWLEERAVVCAPAASREREKLAPVVKKEKKIPNPEHQRPATVVQASNFHGSPLLVTAPSLGLPPSASHGKEYDKGLGHWSDV